MTASAQASSSASPPPADIAGAAVDYSRAEQPQRRTAVLAAAAAAVTVLLWASAFVVIRHVSQDLSAGALSLGRLLVGSALLGIYAYTRTNRQPLRRLTRREWMPLIACGVLWFAVYNLALNAAEHHLDAGTAAMLVNVAPLLIAMLAGVLLSEGFPRQLVVGSTVAFAGVVVIGTSSSSGRAEFWGVVLCLVAASTYAIAVVLQKPLLARMPTAQVTWLACTFGAITLLPFGPDLVREVAGSNLSTIAWVVFLGAFPTALGFTTWAYALARTSAGKMGATTYLVPPVSVVLAWIFLGETPGIAALVGGALCLAGVALARRR